MKYIVTLSWEPQQYTIEAENETAAKNLAIWDNESELYHKAADIKVIEVKK